MNEIFNENGTFRESVFFNVLGEGFVPFVFNLTRSLDPDAKLFINDFNLDQAESPKTQAMVTNVQKWIAEGVPIDGIGKLHIPFSSFASAPTRALEMALTSDSRFRIANSPHRGTLRGRSRSAPGPRCEWGRADRGDGAGYWRRGTGRVHNCGSGLPRHRVVRRHHRLGCVGQGNVTSATHASFMYLKY